MIFRRMMGLGALFALAVATPAFAQSKSAALSTEIDQLTAEAAKLEGTRAVRKLQRAFGYYADRGLWQEVSDLFVDNGSLEFGMDGVYVGKAHIREYLKRLAGQDGLRYGQLNEYVTLQSFVTLAPDGHGAKARWRDLGMLGDFGKNAFWRDGIYENEYVLDNGVWKIRSVHLYINFQANYEGGWTRMKPAPSDWRTDVAKAYPSDKPPTQSYQPFPEPQLPPFHYANPVTGKIFNSKISAGK